MLSEPDSFPKEEPVLEAALAGNANHDSPYDASEYRDIDLAELTPVTSTGYGNTVHGVGEIPTNTRKDALTERRVNANAEQVVSAELVTPSGNRRYSAFTVTAPVGSGAYPGQPVLLLGDDRMRVRTVLSNAHLTDLIIVGPFDQVSTGNGLTLPPNALFETNVTEAIYACVPPAGAEAVGIGVWSEYA